MIYVYDMRIFHGCIILVYSQIFIILRRWITRECLAVFWYLYSAADSPMPM